MKVNYTARAIAYILIASLLSFIMSYFALGIRSEFFWLLFFVEIPLLAILIAIAHSILKGEM